MVCVITKSEMLYNAWHALEALLALHRCLVAISGKTAASEQQAVSFPIDVLRPCTSKLNRIDRHKAVAHLRCSQCKNTGPQRAWIPAADGLFAVRLCESPLQGEAAGTPVQGQP